MSDLNCVYEMDMIQENEQMEQDILSGRGMDVLFCLMDKFVTQDEIAKRLGMPRFSVQLYLQRLIRAGLVCEEVEQVRNGQVIRSYHLASDNLTIINRLKEHVSPQDKRKNEITTQYFLAMVRNAIQSAGKDLSKPARVQACFIKAREKDMKKFTGEIDQLYKQYQDAENLEETDLYGMLTVMGPYEIEE